MGRVSAPHLTVSNNELTLIGKNIHDTDPTVSAQIGVLDVTMRQLSVAVTPPYHYVQSLDIS